VQSDSFSFSPLSLFRPHSRPFGDFPHLMTPFPLLRAFPVFPSVFSPFLPPKLLSLLSGPFTMASLTELTPLSSHPIYFDPPFFSSARRFFLFSNGVPSLNAFCSLFCSSPSSFPRASSLFPHSQFLVCHGVTIPRGRSKLAILLFPPPFRHPPWLTPLPSEASPPHSFNELSRFPFGTRFRMLSPPPHHCWISTNPILTWFSFLPATVVQQKSMISPPSRLFWWSFLTSPPSPFPPFRNSIPLQLYFLFLHLTVGILSLPF